jgi:c(7)-type cytochrome triheme protein
MSLLRLAVGLACLAGVSALPVIGAATADGPPRVELPPDLSYTRSADSPAPVVFRHWVHVALSGNRCDGCHPATFRIVHPDRQASHEQMDAGEGCGTCHDGEHAFGSTDEDACLYCHGGESPLAPMPAAPEGRLLGTSTLAFSPDSIGPVRFDHAVHLGDAATCSACHPRLAPMGTGSPSPSKDEMLGGAGCGACHDGTRAFGVDEECERCHVEEAP